MKITAQRITAGSKIKVSSLVDQTEMIENFINAENLSQGTIGLYQKMKDRGSFVVVGLGSIKASSPVLEVYKVEDLDSWSYYNNGRKVSFKTIMLHTDKGLIRIGTRQKVEFIGKIPAEDPSQEPSTEPSQEPSQELKSQLGERLASELSPETIADLEQALEDKKAKEEIREKIYSNPEELKRMLRESPELITEDLFKPVKTKADIQADPRVFALDRETDEYEGPAYWCYLISGFEYNNNPGSHTAHERTIKEICEELNSVSLWLDDPDLQEEPTEEPKEEIHISRAQSNAYNAAYDYFNKALFGGTLGTCILTLEERKRSKGFLKWDSWEHIAGGPEKVYQINLTPSLIAKEGRAYLSTLVHEMVHLWQFTQGENLPANKSYHNKEWAAKMEALGLMPSSTGEVGEKKTGQKMTHYVIDGGPYDIAFQDAPEEIFLPFKMTPQYKLNIKKSGRVKYVCGCGDNFRAKRGLSVSCNTCGEDFQAEE